MGALAAQINSMVNQLREPEQLLVFEIIKRFLPDDVATPQDLIDIAIARAEYARGETTKDEDMDWE